MCGLNISGSGYRKVQCESVGWIELAEYRYMWIVRLWVGLSWFRKGTGQCGSVGWNEPAHNGDRCYMRVWFGWSWVKIGI
jgi:hypothetical protein